MQDIRYNPKNEIVTSLPNIKDAKEGVSYYLRSGNYYKPRVLFAGQWFEPFVYNNLVYYKKIGERVSVWDDLKFPASGINPIGAVSDPTIETTGNFLGTLLFSPTVINVVAGVAQMPHAWEEGRPIRPHVHWSPTSTGTGNVLWRLQYLVADVHETFGTTLTTLNVVEAADGITNKHQIVGLGEIPMTDKLLSSIIVWQLSRIATDASDTYADNARLLEFDIHYEIDSDGSLEETNKKEI